MNQSMDVLLINVPIAFNMNENLEPPLGVTYMGAMLREHGHNPTIKDYEVEEFDPDVFKKYIAENPPSFVGISSRTASYSSAKYLTELVKEVNEGVCVVLGGHHVTVYDRQSIDETLADIVVRGEGEIAVLDILEVLRGEKDISSVDGITYRKSSFPTNTNGNAEANGADNVRNKDRTEYNDLDSLPFPAWDLLPLHRYTVSNVITSRGCPYSCTYCDKAISTRKIRYRSPELVIKEIQELRAVAKAPIIYFCDDVFFLNKKRVSEMFDKMEEANLDIDWVCQSRTSPMDHSLLPRAAALGCKMIIFGIESGDETELRFINKQQSLQEVRDTCNATHNAGIRVRANFMLGFPITTKETMKNTIRFAASIPLDICRFFIVVPFPNTGIWDYIFEHDLAKDPRFIDHNGERTFDWDQFDLYRPSYEIPGVTHSDLLNYSGAAFLHVLQRSIAKEVFLHGIPNFVKFAKLYIKNRKIRGNVSQSFPQLGNLVGELYHLTKGKSVMQRIAYAFRIILLDIVITFFHRAPKTETYSIKNQNHPDIEQKTSTRVAFPTVTFNQQPNNWKGKQVQAKIEKLDLVDSLKLPY